MKRISIIVPVYNSAEFLDDCLKSLISQSYKNIEILVINDSSEDESEKIINEYLEKDDRIISHTFIENKGVGAARNFGLKHATGEYVYFVDSDDFIPSNTLQMLIDNIGDHSIISGRLKRTNISVAEMDENDKELNVVYYKAKRAKLFKNKSILNRLISKELIDEFEIHFSEEVDFFTDISFIVEILTHVEEIPYIKQCIYLKRRRNDPVTNPSLMQRGMQEKIKDFTKLYVQLKDQYTEFTIASKYLDQQFLNYYRKSIVVYFKEEKNVDLVFHDLVTAMNKVDAYFLSNKSFLLKREAKPLIMDNIEKYKKVNQTHQFLRNVKKAMKGKRSLYLQLYRSFFTKLPIDNKLVVFESFLGKNYSDNPKYIYEYMISENIHYKYVWIFNEPGKKIIGNPKQIKRFSIKYYYYMARAKYWVSNARIPKSLGKRKENIYLQTWHGTPLKTLAFDIKDIYSADPNHKKDFYIQSRRWDYLISPNQYSTDIFRRAFKFDKEMLEYGYPRNDILYSDNNEPKIQSIKQSLQLPEDKKVILYAPTWRDDEFVTRGQYKFTLNLELDKMKEELKDDYIVVLRTHYHIANQLDLSGFEGFVYDMSKYDDIAELYLISDMLITDYSSVFFDYANLRRPILFYTYDLEKYRDTLRGFYFDIEEEVPGPLLKTTEEVIHSVVNIEKVNEDYQEKYNKFYAKFCKWEDENASEKVVRRVFK